ncbi:hypothetical protein HMPREF1555_00493, partial [Porphyromonas gingivalis F0570]
MLLYFPLYGRLYPFGSCDNSNSNPLILLRYSERYCKCLSTITQNTREKSFQQR